tara:strand:+ start:4192 stop:5121 length:930 start_codon:yes stop_codon:yes gene_type:complete
MFRYKLFLLLTIGMVQVWGQSIVIPQQQVQWRNIMGNNYSPFDKQEFYYKAMIEVNVPSSLIGDYFIGFELPGNDIKRRLTNSSNETLTYFLTAKTNTNQYLLDWPMINNQENTIAFSLTGKHSSILRFPVYIWIDPGQKVTPQTFLGTIVMNIYEGAYNQGGQPNKVAMGNISLSVTISDDIQISLGNDQFNRISEFNVTFETLKAGEVIAYNAFVNSFESYVLTFKSAGKGRLKHRLNQIKTAIPYDVMVDGQLLQFDDFGVAVLQVDRDGTSKKSQHTIKMVLGNAKHAFKGEYTDRLTLRAKPKN